MNTNKNKIHFEVSERKILLRIFDVVFVVLAIHLIGVSFDLQYLYSVTTHISYALSLAFYINLMGTIFEMYNLQVSSNQFQIIKSTLITTSVTVLLYLLTPVYAAQLPSQRLELLVFYITILVALISWRMFYVKFLASNRFVQNVLLVCDKEQIEELILGLENVDPHYKIIAYVNADSVENDKFEYHFVKNIRIEDLVSFVAENNIFEIVVASQKTEGITVDLYQKLLCLLESGNTIREYTQVYEAKTQRIPVQYINRDFYKFFPFNRSNNNQIYLATIKFFEILVSVLGLLFGVLLLPFIIIGNTIGNSGTLFYTQERVGKNGALFKIFKFRTMVQNAEANGGAVFSTSNDRRITAFGKFLRRTRIDEIPQFVNILKGEMAVIGPRPERPFFVKEIAEIMPFYETRHVIKPGLTGWAQVNYSYGESLEDSLVKLQYDLYYIKHRSIFLDFTIAFKTISTVLFYRGQ